MSVMSLTAWGNGRDVKNILVAEHPESRQMSDYSIELVHKIHLSKKK